MYTTPDDDVHTVDRNLQPGHFLLFHFYIVVPIHSNSKTTVHLSLPSNPTDRQIHLGMYLRKVLEAS